MIDAVERLVNLAMLFAATRSTLTAEQVRAEVFGYPEDQDDAAFIRMFERDKDDLRRMGFVIESDSEGRYRLDRDATYSTDVELTPAEVSAVRTAASALLGDASFPFSADLRLALAKIDAEPAGGETVASACLADEEPELQGDRVAVLTSAAAARKRVEFGYTNSRGVSAPHVIEPYGLFVHDGRWYLVGRDTEKDEVRTYTVARMDEPRANTASPKTPDFERPDDFDVARFIRLPFQYGSPAEEFIASLLFAPSCAWRAETLSAGQGTLTPSDDGSVTWLVPARSARGVARFAIENGPGVEVVAPPELVALVTEGLARTEALHG